MKASKVAYLVTSTLLFYSSLAQLSGEILYDGINTLQVTISNPTPWSYSILATNTLFDRQTQVPYSPVTIIDSQNQTIKLNGTKSEPSPSGLSDAEYQNLESGSQYVRNLFLSDYLLPQPSRAIRPAPMFTVGLPTEVLAIDITGKPPSKTLASWYLQVGLKTVNISSPPLTFNYSLPATTLITRRNMLRRRSLKVRGAPLLKEMAT